MRVYLDFNKLPDWLLNPDNMEYNIEMDTADKEIPSHFFIIKTKDSGKGVKKEYQQTGRLWTWPAIGKGDLFSGF